VFNNNVPSSAAVILTCLEKTYPKYQFGCFRDRKNDYKAVKGVTYVIEEGQLFCLLGHNGAGKTTTINMLTGMFLPTGGDATILGNSIIDGMDSIRKVMGYCPQHDLLWGQLTAKEHLEMFAAFKGMPKREIQKEVEERLKDVNLLDQKDIQTLAFSAGMKRRLSTAIALTANPQIVFLDEPTTGMDPVSRRQVWNLIEQYKKNRVIVLTTHSMEEADILGDKIGIMSHGQLSCIGTSLHLKNKFGAGYRVTLTMNGSDDSEWEANGKKYKVFLKKHLKSWNFHHLN